eukprot:TRINITY_DN3859_c0_g2_i1.p1 TRINITY_DN3859_c0_g2~~TRINITY_DN3859_c0_g2_i1.p1  ORF type:complete len:371 (+),score=66.00 TRINITY_DN3859_c0_g2_i1:55-1113(+)
MQIIDGSKGGGQILRNGFAYAALTGRPIRMENIRGSRKPAGFRSQHLAGVKVCREIVGGTLEGAVIGSQEATFVPNPNFYKETPSEDTTITVDAITAGSTSLLVQSTLPLLAFGKPGNSFLTVKGGTDVAFSPPLDYLLRVFLPTARRFGIDVSLGNYRRGVYPKGGGFVDFKIARSMSLDPVEMIDPGVPSKIWARVFVTPKGGRSDADCSAMKRLVMKRISEVEELKNCEVNIEMEVSDANNQGGGAVVVVESTTGCRQGCSALKERGGFEFNTSFNFNVAVDEYLQDQVIVLAALATGRSRFLTPPLTDHTKCAIKVAEDMLGAKFDIEPHGDCGNLIISCEGIGFRCC